MLLQLESHSAPHRIGPCEKILLGSQSPQWCGSLCTVPSPMPAFLLLARQGTPPPPAGHAERGHGPPTACPLSDSQVLPCDHLPVGPTLSLSVSFMELACPWALTPQILCPSTFMDPLQEAWMTTGSFTEGSETWPLGGDSQHQGGDSRVSGSHR